MADSTLPSKKGVARKRVMKSFSIGMKGVKRVFRPGGNFRYVDPELGPVLMKSGDIKDVPVSVIEEANSHSKEAPIFVEPGTQAEGIDKDAEIKDGKEVKSKEA